MRAYDRAWLRADLVAGLTTAAVVVPQAMAYADIAGLPLGVKLRTALVPPSVYAVMGTSRPLSVTTTSTIAILTAGALHEIAPGANDDVLISATATLAFLAGGILCGCISPAARHCSQFHRNWSLVGFKAGVGLVIVVDQLPKLLGVHTSQSCFGGGIICLRHPCPRFCWRWLMLAWQIGLQRFLPRVPGALVTVAAGIAASSLAGLNRLGIELVGEVREGLPPLLSRKQPCSLT